MPAPRPSLKWVPKPWKARTVQLQLTSQSSIARVLKFGLRLLSSRPNPKSARGRGPSNSKSMSECRLRNILEQKTNLRQVKEASGSAAIHRRCWPFSSLLQTSLPPAHLPSLISQNDKTLNRRRQQIERRNKEHLFSCRNSQVSMLSLSSRLLATASILLLISSELSESGSRRFAVNCCVKEPDSNTISISMDSFDEIIVRKALRRRTWFLSCTFPCYT